ncbi:MAG: glycosyltransferase [Candidatus Puniceispirillaceae bacterium]
MTKTSNSKKRILFLCSNSGEAGAPRHVETLIRNVTDDYECGALFGGDGPVARRLKDDGFTIFFDPNLKSEIDIIGDMKSLFYLYGVMKDFKPDLIHCHSSKAGLLGRLVAWLLNIPVIYSVHGWGWRGYGAIKRSVIWVSEWFTSFFSKAHYIFVSDYVRQHAIKAHLGQTVKFGKVVYNGIEDVFGNSFNQEKELGSGILMPARVSSAKDHKSLLAAFEMSRTSEALLLCGEGTQTKAFQEMAKLYAPTKFHNITFLGERQDVFDLLSHVRIMVLCSHFEALPISLIEAMSAGKAVVATKVGGVPELITDGQDGYLYDHQNVAMLAQCLDKLTDDHLCKKLGKQARKSYLAKFSLQKMIADIVDIYDTSFKR